MNYTNEDVNTIVKTYNPSDTEDKRRAAVATLAAKLHHSEASVRAKIQSLGLWKNFTHKVVKVREQKEELVAQIAQITKTDPTALKGLNSASFEALSTLANALKS